MTTGNLAYQDCLSGYSTYQDDINASTIVQDMLAKLNKQNTYFIVKACPGINNACAVKYGGARYILLDIRWMESIKLNKNDWSHLLIIGHEMGHHLLGHTDHSANSLEQSRAQELAADEIGGYLLAAYGIADEQVETLFRTIGDATTNSTHPGRIARLASVRKGISSSRRSEPNMLLHNITQEAGLDLTNLPHLVTIARNSFAHYLASLDKRDLKLAIEHYQQAIRFSKTPELLHEMAALFIANREEERFLKSLEYLYNINKNPNFLLEVAAYYRTTRNKSAGSFLSRYQSVLNDISTLSQLDPYNAVSFAKYHLPNTEELGSTSLTFLPAIESALHALVTKDPVRTENEDKATLLSEAHNTLGLLNLRKADYPKAREHFKLAAAYLATSNALSNIHEIMYDGYSLNNLRVLANLSLVEIRLQNWVEAMKYAYELENAYSDFQAKDGNLALLGFEYADVPYYKGRANQGLKQYEAAISCYSQALALSPKGYLHFYRGLCLMNLQRTSEACADFQKACFLDPKTACDRFKNFCR